MMNGLESEFVDDAIDRGFSVFRQGWPDFLIVKDGETQGVEVKGPNDYVKDNQMRMMNALAEAGIDCWVYRSEWRNPDIIKQTGKKDDILDELIRGYTRMIKRIRSKVEKIKEFDYDLCRSLRSPELNRRLKRQEWRRDSLIEDALKICNSPPTGVSLRLIKKWNRQVDEIS